MGETMGQYAARLERENSDKQQRINHAVRDLDQLAELLRRQGPTLNNVVGDVLSIQKRLADR